MLRTPLFVSLFVSTTTFVFTTLPVKSWDDPTINVNSLQVFCDKGTQMNVLAQIARDSSTNPYSNSQNAPTLVSSMFKTMMMKGNMTPSDYRGIRQWFVSNCPEGW